MVLPTPTVGKVAFFFSCCLVYLDSGPQMFKEACLLFGGGLPVAMYLHPEKGRHQCLSMLCSTTTVSVSILKQTWEAACFPHDEHTLFARMWGYLCCPDNRGSSHPLVRFQQTAYSSIGLPIRKCPLRAECSYFGERRKKIGSIN